MAKANKTTSQMRRMVRELQNLLKAYDDAEEAKFQAVNERDWNRASHELETRANQLNSQMNAMVSQLNILMSCADAIDIHDYFKMEKVRFTH